MATPQQIEANRQNAQASTGPKTDAGKERSSLNATRHGFTGQSLVLCHEEKEAYEFHVLAYMEQYAPTNHVETELVQRYADQRWSLHQLAVQQFNLNSLINALTAQLMKEGDLQAVIAATAKPHKTLATLGIYENRRLRAVEDTLDRLTAMLEARKEALIQAAKLYKVHKTSNKPFTPAEFGFVCSLPEIERHIARESAIPGSKTANSV